MPEPTSVDLIVSGGSIITMDAARRIIRDGALAITRDRIVAVGKPAHVHLGHTSLAESTETCVRENALVMEKYAGGFANNLVRPCVNIVGLGRVSDALIVKSKELADKYGAILNMHQCAFPEEVESIRQRTGRTPIKQLEHLGALGPNVVLVHMLHVTDEE